MRPAGPPSLAYTLPPGRIATRPARDRSRARLFVFDRSGGRREHARVACLAAYLRKGDLLVLNEVRVDPVRVHWSKPSGGAAELFLLRCLESEPGRSTWEALLGGKKLRAGAAYLLPGGRRLAVERRNSGGPATVRLDAAEAEVQRWLKRVGSVPLPPYILSERRRRGERVYRPSDSRRYQTVFASRSGAVAAPTAGLHFTPELLRQLRGRGIETAAVYLAVGWGTFAPLQARDWKKRKLHPEHVEICARAARAILDAKRERRRVIAVGTTVVRALEWWARRGPSAEGIRGECDLFLRPPWKPRLVDGLVTNFHLPGSSLLALVAGFVGGEELLLELYREAIEKEYRFYSYGDAMLIL